jgi:hypothetical protein
LRADGHVREIIAQPEAITPPWQKIAAVRSQPSENQEIRTAEIAFKNEGF